MWCIIVNVRRFESNQKAGQIDRDGHRVRVADAAAAGYFWTGDATLAWAFLDN